MIVTYTLFLLHGFVGVYQVISLRSMRKYYIRNDFIYIRRSFKAFVNM